MSIFSTLKAIFTGTTAAQELPQKRTYRSKSEWRKVFRDNEGKAPKQIAKDLGVNLNTVYNAKKRIDASDARKRAPKRTDEQWGNLFARYPDLTAAEIAKRTGVAPMTVYGARARCRAKMQ